VRFARAEVNARLGATVAARRPIVIASAGSGLVARCLELGGADAVAAYSLARFGIMGFPRLAGQMPFGNANRLMLEYGVNEVLRAVRDVPVIAGVCATDPTIDIVSFLETLDEVGFSGVTNVPTVGTFGPGYFAQVLEDTAMGSARELEMLELARQRGFWTMALVATADEAKQAAAVGVDAIVPNAGLTGGGLFGARTGWTTEGVDGAARFTQELIDAARTADASALFLCHGGPISSVEDVAHVIAKTEAVGHFAGMALESLAIEQAVTARTREMKGITLGPR
jgi:predicted TIM-barrel enzyme